MSLSTWLVRRWCAQGNDGLWVVEYDTEKLMLEELGRIQLEKLDVPILKTHKLSIVVGG